MKKKYSYNTFVLLIFSIISCNSFVTVSPPNTNLTSKSVYSQNSTASAAVTGIYSTMVNNSIGGKATGISALLGLSADEFTLYPTSNTNLNEAYSNSLTSINPAPFWKQLYNCIYQANMAIEGLTNQNTVSPQIKDQLLGEASFVRAFCHFYLLEIYGDIPIVTTTDYHQNELPKRISAQEVFQQILADLRIASSLLSNEYLGPDGIQTNSRVRPNKGAVLALLSRVFLYEERWDSAEIYAGEVIENEKYSLMEDLNLVFTANNEESIWQLEPPNNGFNAPDGSLIASIINTGKPNSNSPFLLNKDLYNSFEDNDLRRSLWIGTIASNLDTLYYPFKYKLYSTGTAPKEYAVVLRLAEQFLIRAEARAMQNKITLCQYDLNKIRLRAGLDSINLINKTDAIKEIYKERRLELFTEYGHRWLDMKRTNQIDSIMAQAIMTKAGSWESTDKLYPIPSSEILINNNIIQNPGYE